MAVNQGRAVCGKNCVPMACKLHSNGMFVKLSLHVQTSLAPVSILRAGAEEERSEMARMSSFVGAIAVGDLVKSTLGPKGMVGYNLLSITILLIFL